MNKQNIGFEKEKDIANFLIGKGFEILNLNFTLPCGEIDIVAKDKRDIVFIEVKYRKSNYAGTPQEAVSIQKQKKLIKTALIYMQQNEISANVRFDVAAISKDKIEIIRSAFVPDENIYCF
ncbi:MAG: YraN family protein [Elusimicrobiota bacterium]|nr:YraN family protein [Elusimicrobiota bacterium]